jgi:hypothetical protein
LQNEKSLPVPNTVRVLFIVRSGMNYFRSGSDFSNITNLELIDEYGTHNRKIVLNEKYKYQVP